MPQSLANIHLHIIFSTKERLPLISSELAPRLYEYIGGIIRRRRCRLVGAGGMPDHIHLLVSFGRDLSVAELVRDVKSNSSGWVHDTFPARSFAWQTGYGVFSVSHSLVPSVCQYIQKQAKHHVSMTFQDEYRAFLRKHGIEFDERYVWA